MADSIRPMEGSALERLADEELVVLARDGHVPALHVLTLRYLERIERQVTHLARKWHLSREDTADARQEAAAFWLAEAIRAYVEQNYRGPTGCRFVTLQHRVITRRFSNFARDLLRQACHCAGAGGLTELADQGVRRLDGSFAAELADPGRTAERHEEEELLARVVAYLPERDRALWMWVARGNSLRAWARDHAVDYKKVQRWWCNLRGAVGKQWPRHKWEAGRLAIPVRPCA